MINVQLMPRKPPSSYGGLNMVGRISPAKMKKRTFMQRKEHGAKGEKCDTDSASWGCKGFAVAREQVSLGKSKDSPNKSFQAFNNHFHPY